MTLTKAELVEIVCVKSALSKSEARELVDNFFSEISNALVQGEPVKISGLGNFTVRNKNARPGRNPRTGKEVTITERRVVTFKQGHKLKSLLERANIAGSKA